MNEQHPSARAFVSPECSTCDLSIYCKVQKDLEANPIASFPNSAEVEAEVALQIAENAAHNVVLQAMYTEWRDRIALKFAGEPDKLAQAFAAIDELYANTMVAQMRADIAGHEYARLVASNEDYLRGQSRAVDEALKLRDKIGCEGRTEVIVGKRFFGLLGKKTLRRCGLEGTAEFTKVREYRDADHKLAEEYSRP